LGQPYFSSFGFAACEGSYAPFTNHYKIPSLHSREE
jgi:hypothetical protein